MIVLLLIAGYLLLESMPSYFTLGTLHEGFTTQVVSVEADSEARDARYAASNVDLQHTGYAVDFCRAVGDGEDGDLQVICDRADGSAPLVSRTVRDGFRMSRDDYWSAKGDYCRILKETDGDDTWSAKCAVPTKDLRTFKKEELTDGDPPPSIQRMLRAYDGVLVWWRFVDDRVEYAQNAAFAEVGTPVFPPSKLLNPLKSRGLQLNRELSVEPRDYLRIGEQSGEQSGIRSGEQSGTRSGEGSREGTSDTLFAPFQHIISPRQIRAFAFWVWWDGFESGATVFEAHNVSKAVHRKDRIAIGIEGGGPDPSPPQIPVPGAQEVTPQTLLAIGDQLTLPTQEHPHIPTPTSLTTTGSVSLTQSATYYFEIWDEEQRIMRLTAPMSSAKTNSWQHIVVSTTDGSAWWPTWGLWIDGELVATKTDGRLSPAMVLTEVSVGKRMRGCLMDFRIYRSPLDPAKIKETMEWAKERLMPNP